MVSKFLFVCLIFKVSEHLTVQNKKYFNYIQILDSWWGALQESFNKFMHIVIGFPPPPKKILWPQHWVLDKF